MTHAARLVVMLLSAACVGPGPADLIASPHGVSRITLRGDSAGDTQGLILDTREVVAVVSDGSGYDFQGADFYLVVAREVSLHGSDGSPLFCSQGPGYDAVEDIPTDATGCAWASVRLGAVAPSAPDPMYLDPGEGFLVRPADESRIDRLLLVEASLSADSVATVTFDLVQ